MSKMDENDFVETGNWQLCAKWGQRALPDERAEAVRQLLEKEQTVEQIVSRFNLSSAQVVYGWIGHHLHTQFLHYFFLSLIDNQIPHILKFRIWMSSYPE